MYVNKVGMEETQEYNYPTSFLHYITKVIDSLSGECNSVVWPKARTNCY